jgi:hypothetical protein
MIVVADNDIIHKLALSDLLEEFLEWLQVPPNEVWVLPELKFRIRKKLRNNSSATVCFNNFLLKTKEIPVVMSGTLEIFNALDAGEQQLMAVFFEQETAPRLITGDKRALTQISAIAQQNLVLSEKLRGQIDCLESVMLELINKFGYDNINSKVCLDADGVFRLTFGAGRTQEHAMEALQSFLHDLRSVSLFIRDIQY